MSATTTDPAVVFAVVFATGAGTLLVLVLLKLLIDAASDHATEVGPAPAQRPIVLTHCPPLVPAPAHHAHARPAACDETTPLTTVKAGHGRHRKEAC